MEPHRQRLTRTRFPLLRREPGMPPRCGQGMRDGPAFAGVHVHASAGPPTGRSGAPGTSPPRCPHSSGLPRRRDQPRVDPDGKAGRRVVGPERVPGRRGHGPGSGSRRTFTAAQGVEGALPHLGQLLVPPVTATQVHRVGAIPVSILPGSAMSAFTPKRPTSRCSESERAPPRTWRRRRRRRPPWPAQARVSSGTSRGASRPVDGQRADGGRVSGRACSRRRPPCAA